MDFACEAQNDTLRTLCLQMLSERVLVEPVMRGRLGRYVQGRCWSSALVVCARHGFSEEAGKIIPKVAEANADDIAALKRKVDDSLLTDVCLAKVKKMEKDYDKLEVDNDRLMRDNEQMKKLMDSSSKCK